MSETESLSTEQQQHRKLAVDLFNFVWKLLDKSDRTLEETDLMLHAAHASRYHWNDFGSLNIVRGEWQISHVYARLRRPEPALYHARRCLDVCLANDFGDFDLAYAYEAMARALALSDPNDEAHRYFSLAQAAGEKIAEEDDQKLFQSDLATIPF